MKLKLIKGRGDYPLFDLITKKIGERYIAKTVSHVFSNENIKFKIEESIRGNDTFIIQPNYPDQNEKIVELLIMIDALKHSSAGRITVVLPYFPYSRSDKKEESRISITARLMADMIESAGADRVVVMNLHSPQIQGFFRIPTDHLLPKKIIREYFYTKLPEKVVFVAPDTGSSKMVASYAEAFGTPVAYMNKIRVDDTENPEITHIVGSVKDRNCLILDDEIASGKSIAKAAKKLLQEGAASVEACAMHGVLTNDAIPVLKEASIRRLHITNTIHRPDTDYNDPFIGIIDVSDMFAKAIQCINSNDSITEVF